MNLSNPLTQGLTSALTRPLFGLGTAGAGGVINPSDERLLFWFDASDVATIEDTGGAVDAWRDKSANGNDLTASGAARPTTDASEQNSLNVLDFTGAQSMALDTAIVSKTAGVLFAVVLNTDATNGSAIVARTTTYGVNFIIIDGSAGTSLRLATGGVGSVNTDSIADGYQLTTAHWAGTTSAVRVNSNDDNSTATDGTPDFSVGVVGDYNTTAFDAEGEIAELLYFDGSTAAGQLTEAEMIAIETYLADKWAVAGGYSAAPTNTVAPEITGTENVGETLTVSNGEWVSYLPITAYTYQWFNDGVAISGATSSTYLLDAADETDLITATVDAANANGSTSAVSAATGAIGEEITIGGPAKALDLDGSSSYMYANNSSWGGLSRDIMMIAVSVKPDVLGNEMIVSRHGRGGYTQNEWRIRALSDGRIQWIVYDGLDSTNGALTTPVSGPKLVAGEYNTIVVAFNHAALADNDKMKMWVNGVAVAYTDYNVPEGAIGVESAEVIVGKVQNTEFFGGLIHQLAIFSGIEHDINDILSGADGMKDISGLSGLYSYLDVSGDVVTSDGGSGPVTWVNAGVSVSSDIPS